MGAEKLEKTIGMCISAVMDEQDRQWEEDDDDETKIAECSILATRKNAKRARLTGLDDEKEALLLKAQSWMNNDDESVGSSLSVASYGTAAILKKKKRSEFLSRVDKLSSSMKAANNEEEEATEKKKKKSKKKKKKKK